MPALQQGVHGQGERAQAPEEPALQQWEEAVYNMCQMVEKWSYSEKAYHEIS